MELGKMEKVMETRKLIEGFDFIRISPDGNNGKKFMLLREICYLTRYGKEIVGHPGYKWNGADWVNDLDDGPTMSMAPLIHDVACEFGTFDDGSPISNWQASQVLKDILKDEGRWVRMVPWRWGTFLFGGGFIKKRNGWFSSWKRS
jgi:hypothetical protein